VSFRGLARRGQAQRGANAGYLSVFALAPWIGMILFLFNDRANSGQYRYLIVLVWCLPFLFLQLQAVAGRYTRLLLGGLALFLAVFNLLMSFSLMETWTRPGFAAHHAGMPDPRPAMALLRQNNINHCFAAYWTAYRITFLSDGEITCSQPNNERFPGWPIPFKEEVLRAPRAAYVLTAPDSFDSGFFERGLASCGVACNKTKAGSYTVYQDFSFKNAPSESLIPWGEVEVSASHNPSRAQRLSDGFRNRKWDNGQGQQKGMWLELRLKKPRLLNRVSLHYHDYAHDQAKVLKLSYLQDGRWRPLGPEVPAVLDKCPSAMKIPVREEQVKTIRFKPVLTDALRLEIAEPQKGRLWTMAEVEVYYQGSWGSP
jgi:hypothetical protein